MPLLWRLTLAAMLVVAALVARATLGAGEAAVSGPVLRTVYYFAMAWLATLIILAVTDGESAAARQAARGFTGVRVNPGWLLVYLALAVPLVWPGILAAQVRGYLPHVIAPLALIALLLGLAPASRWTLLLRSTAHLQPRSLLIAAAATGLIHVAQLLWAPATAVTFALVKAQLLPFLPDLRVYPAERILATRTLEVTVAEACSGLEGVGLIFAFCTGWLWHLRQEFRFPRALLILPAAIVVVFLLNSVRISLLFAIAELGFVEVAMAGFHSRAGWIFFLAVAFVIAVVSRRMVWFQRAASEPETGGSTGEPVANPVGAFLMPLLAILATGMLVGAMSAGFETFYSLRLVAGVIALLIYWRFYRTLDWRFSWRGILAGVLVFAVWMFAGRWLTTPADMPDALAGTSPATRAFWIATRAAAAAITVPLAEELAFRGFLMRRLTSADFTAIRLQDASLAALLLSSLLFGLTHGSFWMPGILAGLAYGVVAMRTGRIGEAVMAHAVTNALLAAVVILRGQWQFW